MCGLCRCNNSDVPWTGCSETSNWIPSVWNDSGHALAYPNQHKLFRHAPGLAVLAWIPDWLHSKHIGCDAYFLGSVLMAMFILIDLPGSNSEKLAYV